MNYTALDNLCRELGCELLSEEPMAKHTSFKIGGRADRLVFVPNKAALGQILHLLSKEKIPRFILGNGSNLLVRDGGIRGAVLCLCGEFKEIKLLDNSMIYCGAGATLSSLCVFAKCSGLTGLEFAYGIPGTAGGGAYMNAGAYGGEMKDVLVACDHFDADGTEGTFQENELNLGYRKSAYTDKEYVITGLTLKLQPGNREAIAARMEELMNKRRSKQPLEFPSAGSTFKRPEGYFAAALIEECGLKGACVGGAEVSCKHSGFLINKENASCQDVLGLIQRVKDEVQAQKGIALECEVKMIGQD